MNDARIAELLRVCEERNAVIVALDESIRVARRELQAWRSAFGTIDALHERIAALEADVHERGVLIEQLQAACQERLSGMERLSEEAARRSSLLADVTAVLESKSRELEQLRPRARRPS